MKIQYKGKCIQSNEQEMMDFAKQNPLSENGLARCYDLVYNINEELL